MRGTNNWKAQGRDVNFKDCSTSLGTVYSGRKFYEVSPYPAGAQRPIRVAQVAFVSYECALDRDVNFGRCLPRQKVLRGMSGALLLRSAHGLQNMRASRMHISLLLPNSARAHCAHLCYLTSYRAQIGRCFNYYF